MAKRSEGLKARVSDLLIERKVSLSIGEIAGALELTKVDHADVASVLTKLRNEGRVRASIGPASAQRGRRYVKRYIAVERPPERIVVVQEMDLRRQLSFAR